MLQFLGGLFRFATIALSVTILLIKGRVGVLEELSEKRDSW